MTRVYRPVSNISILWKGVICNICRLIVFTDAATPDKLFFELKEDLTLLNLKGKYVIGVESLAFVGTLDVLEPIDNDRLLNDFIKIYASITLKVYTQEIKNGLIH